MNRLTVAFMLISCQISLAQITGISAVTDPKALPLDISQLSLLLNKMWNCEKVVETRRGQVFELRTITSFTLSSDGKVYDYGASGQWSAVENKFLKFTIDKKKDSHNGRLVGAYPVY